MIYLNRHGSSCDEVNLQKLLIERGNKDAAKLLYVQNQLLVRNDAGSVMCDVSGFPSQCGILIAHHFQSFGLESIEMWVELLEKVSKLAQHLVYSQVMMTMPTIALQQWHDAAKKVGFKPIYVFDNHRSGNNNTVYMKEIPL